MTFYKFSVTVMGCCILHPARVTIRIEPLFSGSLYIENPLHFCYTMARVPWAESVALCGLNVCREEVGYGAGGDAAPAGAH